MPKYFSYIFVAASYDTMWDSSTAGCIVTLSKEMALGYVDVLTCPGINSEGLIDPVISFFYFQR